MGVGLYYVCANVGACTRVRDTFHAFIFVVMSFAPPPPHPFSYRNLVR